MKKSSLMLVAILVSLVLVSGAIAMVSEEVVNISKPLSRCGQMAESVSVAYGLQNLGSNESTICSRLTELYGAKNDECSLAISLSNQIRYHMGDIPQREVNMVMYKYCVEEIQYRKSNAKR